MHAVDVMVRDGRAQGPACPGGKRVRSVSGCRRDDPGLL